MNEMKIHDEHIEAMNAFGKVFKRFLWGFYAIRVVMIVGFISFILSPFSIWFRLISAFGVGLMFSMSLDQVAYRIKDAKKQIADCEDQKRMAQEEKVQIRKMKKTIAQKKGMNYVD